MMTEYDKLLIELLRDKIRQWENKCNDQRIEINRLKKELREAKKEVQAIAFVPVCVGIRRV